MSIPIAGIIIAYCLLPVAYCLLPLPTAHSPLAQANANNILLNQLPNSFRGKIHVYF